MVFSLLVFSSSSLAEVLLDTNYFGDGILQNGFGPRSESGNYGFGSDPEASADCALVWEISCDTGTESAEFEMDTQGFFASRLELRHLDGIADDSFKVFISANALDWVNLGKYSDSVSGGSEVWKTSFFDIPPGYSGNLYFMVNSTAAPWPGCDAYGQLAMHYARIYGTSEVPEFGTIASLIALAGAASAFLIVRRKF
jgi:hypothetical protein